MIKQSWMDEVIKVVPIDGRTMKVKLRTKPVMEIFIVYAPQVGRPMDEKEDFHHNLRDKMGRGGWRGERITIVLGDFNVRTGVARSREEKEVIGAFPWIEPRERGGQMLESLEWAEGEDLAEGAGEEDV